MKKSIKIVFTQLIFLCLISSLNAAPGVPETLEGPYTDLFIYAKSLHNAGAYDQAEVEYKRYIFMQNYVQNQDENLSDAFCALAQLYELNGNHSLAAQSIQMAINTLEQNEATSEQLDKLRSLHIEYLTLEAQGTNAFLSDNLFIFSYMNLPDFSEAIKKQAFSAAISNAVLGGRFEYAQNTFNQATGLLPNAWSEQQQAEIITGFEKLSAFKPKKQKLAGYLSFFPGLGQLYAHDYKDAANAFLLNGSIIAVSVWSLCTLDFWTFSLLEFNPLIRFMQGNMYNAQRDAYQYNLKKQQQLSAPILLELKQ